MLKIPLVESKQRNNKSELVYNLVENGMKSGSDVFRRMSERL